MKKNLLMMLFFFLLITVFAIPTRTYALTCGAFKVSVVKNNATTTDLSCYLTYSDARTAMLNHTSDLNNVAVVYNSSNKIVNAKYAIAKLNYSYDATATVYTSASKATKYTSVAKAYGVDAAFLDYDPTYNTAKIKISGVIGWVDMTSNIQEIKPVSRLFTNQIQMETTHNIRSTASATGTDVGDLEAGETVDYYQKITGTDGRYWYRISPDGQATKWIGDFGTDVIEINSGFSLKTYYYATGGDIKHYYAAYMGSLKQYSITIGKAPSYLVSAKNYYSFDGIYFYDSITKMLGDYRVNATTNAINNGNPHYAYYMYLPTRSKTGYNAANLNNIIINKGYRKNKVPGTTYVYSSCNWSSADRSDMSVMYNTGQDFIDMQNAYGVNALMMFGAAINESASGTSKIAFYKNNLFGLGAYDSNPCVGAYSYASPRASVEGFATFTGSSSSGYTNPISGSYYYGSHYGNKGSGMNVSYATDPYWGEKQAANSYNNDKSYGGLDYDVNTIGITKGLNVKLYKEPSTSGTVLYEIKNNKYNKSVYNVPVVVFNKVNVSGANWYKVYTDLALDSNRNVAAVNYNFNNSYGYIREADLYVKNNQPSITVQNQEMVEGSSYNLLTGISATDSEDGNITSSIKISGTYNRNVPGTYTITYTATDDQGFSVSKNATLVVTNSLYARINAADKEISRYVAFNPLTGVTATDFRDGNIAGDIVVTSNNVDVDTEGVYSVTYEVTNSLNNITTKTIQITVVPNANPVINATNKFISIGDTFSPLTGVTATDKEEGNLTGNIQIVGNTVNASALGTYDVSYQLTDAAGNIVNKTITVTVYAKPSDVTGLVKVKTSYDAALISWAPSVGATSYEVYFATSLNGTYKKLGSTTKTTYLQNGLIAGRNYYYKVRAVKVNPSLTNYSNLSSALVVKIIPSTPKISAKKINNSSVRIYATGVSGTSGYEYYIAYSKYGSYSLMARTTSYYYTKTGLKPKVYYFKVRAYRIVNGVRIYSDYSTSLYFKL